MTNDALPRGGTPEARGISSAAVLAFVDAVEKNNLDLHSLMLLRHGQVVVEGWWAPYAPQHPHMLYSLSKSFTATAAGLAIAEGRFSLDDPVLSFFPDDVPATVSNNLAALHVRHLLSMSTGHAEDTTGFLRDSPDGNWVKAFLARPIEHEPGTHFVYNSGATYLVSAIVQKVTGSRVLDYLRPRLFEPLGIGNPTWETCPRGMDVGGWGLSITTEDIAKFGQLYLQKGVWEGEHLLPEAWIEEATTSQVSNGDPAKESDWTQGYGYQFWRSRHNAYRGDGAFGQYCIVFPENDAVLAIMAGTSDMQAVLNCVWEHLLPVMKDGPLPEDPAARERLNQRLTGLTLAAPQGQRTSPVAAQVSGKTYRFAENDQKIETITCDFEKDEAVLTVRDARGTHRVNCGYGGDAWQSGTTTFLQRGVWPARPPRENWSVAAAGAWTAEDTFAVRLCFYETPFAPILSCRFVDADRLVLDLKGNVGFGPAERAPLEGHAAR